MNVGIIFSFSQWVRVIITFLFPLLVAGISMTVVFLFILVIIGACYVWKKSKVSKCKFLPLDICLCVYIYLCML